LLGEFREELEDDRRALKHWPNNGLLTGLEFKALPALGWIDELERRWDEISSVRQRNPAFEGFGQTADELRAHVGIVAARPFYDRLIAEERRSLKEDPASEQERRESIVWYLAASGQVDAARAALDSLLAVGRVPSRQLVILDGTISAMQGDRDGAHRALAQLEHRDAEPKSVGPKIGQDFEFEVVRAEIHALLGEKAEAVELLQETTHAGNAYRHVLHIVLGLDLLKGYPPFDALVRPVDTPESP
jgi:tetratricopeptide (TPR) repeat protein